jgi:hypothetical protein
VVARMMQLSTAEAEFYSVLRAAVLQGSGAIRADIRPVMVQVLEGGTSRSRAEVMGATDPKKPPRARFVPILRPASTRTSFMTPTHQRRRRAKSYFREIELPYA